MAWKMWISLSNCKYRNNLVNKKNLDGITEIRVKVFFCPAYVELLDIPSQFSKWKNVISHILSNISEISPSCSKKEVIFFDRN